jgi:hypothetical protein
MFLNEFGLVRLELGVGCHGGNVYAVLEKPSMGHRVSGKESQWYHRKKEA